MPPDGESKAVSDVVVLSQGGAHREQLTAALRQRGFSTQSVADHRSLAEVVQRSRDPILVVDGGRNQDESVAEIKTLLASAELSDVPLLFVGADADVAEKLLNEAFALATTVNVPFRWQEVQDGVDYLIRTRTLTRRGGVAPTPLPLASVPTVQVPDQLFSLLQKEELVSELFGGDGYSSGRRIELEDPRHLFPNQPFAELFEDVCKRLGARARGHLARVAFVGRRLAVPLKLGEQGVAAVHQAAFLLAWSIPKTGREVLERDYLRTENKEIRDRFALFVRSSAEKVKRELGDPFLWQVLDRAAKVLDGSSGTLPDDPVTRAAALVVGSDLMDRIAFRAGVWNPRAAYYLIQQHKRGSLNFLHPLVVACIMKFCAEAVVEAPPAFLVPKPIREGVEAKARQSALENGVLASSEKRVELKKLVPGMKLARPLVTWDGSEVLAANLTVDEDLLWRIWQLAALRPIHSTVIVESEKP